MNTQCKVVKQDGTQCRGKARPSGFCFAHDPALRGARTEGQAAGGKNKRTSARLSKLMPSSLKPVLEKLMDGLDEVHEGTLDPRQASAMASLAGAIGRLSEVAELEQRLDALEKANEQVG